MSDHDDWLESDSDYCGFHLSAWYKMVVWEMGLRAHCGTLRQLMLTYIIAAESRKDIVAGYTTTFFV